VIFWDYVVIAYLFTALALVVILDRRR